MKKHIGLEVYETSPEAPGITLGDLTRGEVFCFTKSSKETIAYMMVLSLMAGYVQLNGPSAGTVYNFDERDTHKRVMRCRVQAHIYIEGLR